MNDIPSPDQIFPHACRTSCFIKNVIKAPNISVGEYTYYDDPIDPKRVWTARCPIQLSRIRRSPDHRQVLPDRLSAKFIMSSADHRLCSVSTYPFDVMGGTRTENTTPHVPSWPEIFLLIRFTAAIQQKRAKTALTMNWKSCCDSAGGTWNRSCWPRSFRCSATPT